MRRKSERSAGKKGKASPEKKLEKLKRSRNRRRKQSTSSENESAEETSPVHEIETSEVEKKPPQTPIKEGTVEETQDQVWHVKTAESSGDTGEIKKLKICLTRPPSTPERVDRSPRSKRKHTRATSSSDTPSVEAVEEKKKGKHRSKRTTRESKDESEKNHDSQGDEPEMEMEVQPTEENINEISQSVEVTQETRLDEIPMSTTNEETKTDENTKVVESTSNKDELKKEDKKTETDIQGKLSDADTTVVSPKAETRENTFDDVVSEKDCVIQTKCVSVEKSDESDVQDSKLVESKVIEPQEESKPKSTSVIQDHKESTSGTQNQKDSTSRTQDQKESTSETQDQKESSSGTQDQNESTSGTQDQKGSTGTQDQKESTSGTQDQKESTSGTQDQKESSSETQDQKQSNGASQDEESSTSVYQDKMEVSSDAEVSKSEDKVENASQKAEYSQNESIKATNETDIVESSENIERKDMRKTTAEDSKEENVEKVHKSKDLERSNSTQSVHEEISTHNGQATPLIINRKRRWGSRASKVTSQKSITISTDVLKEIIPDVKPVEFDEVIEEKKHHKRVEITEKIERPILPKIVIDNTENMEQHRKELEDKNKENVKARECHLALNRKISIIKDNESIITRPPSPPRHKQSCILYITNLVRPFTLPQLKNLLQRTGRIDEDGFWIDRIKSKCYVKYETEDQAVETRHALHGVTWPVSNPKTLHVDFSNQEAFDKAKANEETDNAQASTIPGTVEDWLREQDLKRERGELEKPWERKPAVREWDVGKNDKEKDKDKLRRDDRPMEKRRHRSPERSPEPARKFKKKEEEAPAKLLDDLFRKTKTTPCIYWLPLSAETIAIKEEQRRQHMAEHERRLQELRRSHRRH